MIHQFKVCFTFDRKYVSSNNIEESGFLSILDSSCVGHESDEPTYHLMESQELSELIESLYAEAGGPIDPKLGFADSYYTTDPDIDYTDGSETIYGLHVELA